MRTNGALDECSGESMSSTSGTEAVLKLGISDGVEGMDGWLP